jgi:hypothetical protein
MILILTCDEDGPADYVAAKLRQRGADFRRFDPARFPSAAQLSLAYSSSGKDRCLLRVGNETIDLSTITAVWNRRPQTPVPHDEIVDKACREYLQEECKTFIDDTWDVLECRWLPAKPQVTRRASLKASQLRAASELGFEVPPTLVTNSPQDFLAFYRQHNGNVVSKLAETSLWRVMPSEFCRYTEIVSKRDVGHAESVRYGPVIFQAYVPKRLEIRVTAVDRELFAVEIHSQQTNHTRHDWRRYDLYHTPHLPHELPQNVRERCLKLVERLGLCYGAIDLILTPDGRYVFLEINPNGQYLWLEEMAGHPISDAICDFLASGHVGDRLPSPSLIPLSGGCP